MNVCELIIPDSTSSEAVGFSYYEIYARTSQFLSYFTEKSLNCVDNTFSRWMILRYSAAAHQTRTSINLPVQKAVSCILPLNFKHPVIISHVLWNAFGVCIYLSLVWKWSVISYPIAPSIGAATSWRQAESVMAEHWSRLVCATPSVESVRIILLFSKDILIWSKVTVKTYIFITKNN